MVFIKKLELRGFKSFGNKAVSITFDQGFTAVTGPNGSGKSNIVDAIIFCLGQNSSKKLRVDRLTSLIYDGGPSISRPQATRVTVTFDNSTRSIPVDSETVSVTRELRQTGESVYLLNGRHVSKNTLSEMLSLAMINPEGINFVLQGLVTRVSELLPDEKRKLLEEIFGVAQFDEKKAQAMEQLREADTKLQIALARIDEIKNRVDSLEAERNDQLRLKSLEGEIRWLKAVIASKRLAHVRERIVEERGVLEECRAGLGRLEGELAELDREIEAVEAEKGAFLSNVIDDTGGRKVEIELSIGRAQSAIERLTKDTAEAEALVEKIERSLPHLEKMRNQRRGEVETLQHQVEEVEAQNAQTEAAKKEAEREIDEVERRIGRLQTAVKKRGAIVEKLERRLASYSRRLGEAERSLESAQGRAALISEKLQGFKEKSQSFSEMFGELENRLRELEELQRLEAEGIGLMDADLSEISNREGRLQEEIARAVSTLGRVSEALIRYEAQRAVAADDIGFLKLEELADAGAVEGFIGWFEELISYDPEYEKALLTAGGRWMKAAVVKDIQGMLKLVEAARRLKVGRLTAIPLSEVSSSTKVRPPSAEGVVASLSDVVRAEEGLEGLVNFVFGDVVLVKSPRAGYLACLQGFRSVTTSGDVFEPRGVAFETGYVTGFHTVLDLVRDEASLSAVQEAVQSLRKIVSQRRSDLEELQAKSKSLFKKKTERSLALERVKAELAGLKGFVRRYRRIRKGIELKLVQYTKAGEGCERQIKRFIDQGAKLRGRMQACEAKIAEADVKAVYSEISRLEEERAAKGRAIEVLSLKLTEGATQLVKMRANLEHNLKPSYSNISEQIRISQEEMASKKKLIEEGRLKLGELQSEHKRLKGEEERLIAASRSSRPIMEGYEGRLSRLRRRRDEQKRGMSNLEKRIVSIEKGLEGLAESERNLLGELTLYGYSEPVEVFDAVEALLEELNLEYQRLRGGVNLLAERSYQEVFTGYMNLSFRRNELEVERGAIVKFIEDVDVEKKKVFMRGFEKVDRELRVIFTELTGGAAWLELEDPDEIFSSGVFLMTQFPSKLPRESSAVSGGEKTVSALSFILAIQAVYPSPFYVFDEIDAHLDPVNSERLSDLLQMRARNAQIITVSLKDVILSRASLVYGVYMEGGSSQMVRYRPGLEVVVRSGDRAG